jgi:two-component system, LytTR family, response regulator
MKALLVDDEPDGIRALTKMLELNCPDVQIAAACNNAESAKEQLQTIQPDVLFLDIRMPGKSGLEMLAELPVKNFEVIFVTAHNEYMLQAFQFSAVDYLMKPVDEDRLIEAVERVKKRMYREKNTAQSDALLHNISKAGSPSEMRLCLPTQKGFTIVKLEEILYCEAERSYTVFHFVNSRPVVVSKPLYDYEKLLNDTSFMRIHKSFLVNLLHVKEYLRGEGGTIIMTNGTEIEVSRRKKEQFLEKIRDVFRY